MPTEKKKSTKANYVDNKKFYEEIVKYKKKKLESLNAGLAPPIIPNYLGECIYNIAVKFSTMSKFSSYSFREEMIGDGIENCFQYFDGFDSEKYHNPFAYFTQIIYHAFLRRIAKEQKMRYTTYKYFQESMLDSELGDRLLDSNDNNIVSAKLYDNMNDLIRNFEEQEEKKKQKRKEMKNLQKFILEDDNEGTIESTAGSGSIS